MNLRRNLTSVNACNLKFTLRGSAREELNKSLSRKLCQLSQATIHEKSSHSYEIAVSAVPQQVDKISLHKKVNNAFYSLASTTLWLL
jgi:uncharacterized Zn finger protein